MATEFTDTKTGVLINAPEEGTLIHGTLNIAHLIDAFLNATLYTPEYEEMRSKDDHPIHMALILLDENDDQDEFWSSDDAAYLYEQLVDILNKYAPEGKTFAAHIGDGSDFGYWPSEDYEI